jgi:hypothetical protein
MNTTANLKARSCERLALADAREFQETGIDRLRAESEGLRRTFSLQFAERSRPGQREEYDLFARDGADVVMQAQHLDACDFLN